MTRGFSKLMLIAASATVALAPVAAQANTRPGQTRTYPVSSAEAVAAYYQAKEMDDGDRAVTGLIALLAMALAATGIAIALSDGSNQSNGAN